MLSYVDVDVDMEEGILINQIHSLSGWAGRSGDRLWVALARVRCLLRRRFAAYRYAGR